MYSRVRPLICDHTINGVMLPDIMNMNMIVEGSLREHTANSIRGEHVELLQQVSVARRGRVQHSYGWGGEYSIMELLG